MDVRLWHDQALIKNAGDSKETDWHQDLPYWPMAQPGALSCWLALDDVDESNGCMQFIPGSHQLGIFDPVDLIEGSSLLELASSRHGALPAPHVARMRAGSCTFHDGRTFHFAFANRSPSPRRAMITIYMPDATIFNGAQHVVTDGLGLNPGRPLEGELFPLLTGQPQSQG